MNGVQIGILAVAGIILTLFIKYKITGSVRTEFHLLGKGLDRGYEIFATVACVGALVSVACAGLIVYSVVTPPVETDRTTITAKHKTADRDSYSYGVEVVGRKSARYHTVSRSFYDKAAEGDTVEVTLSRFFRDWQDVRIIRNNQLVYEEFGPDWFGLVLAVFFVLPLYSFRLVSRMREKRIMGSVVFVIIALFELIPLGIIFCR